MTKVPKVSVIMPAYNTEKYVGAAIESILNQSFKDFEFIIVNDGSTDDTAKVVREYAAKDKRIKFIDSKKNEGFIASLNKCLDKASGEYIAKMDSDDISLPERLEKQVSYLDNNINCGLVGCGYRAFGKADFEVIHPSHVGIIDLINTCATTIFVCRKSVVDTFHLRFNPDFLCAEDYDFYSRFIRYSDIHNLQEVLYLYRWHGENTSIKKSKVQQANSKRVRENLLDMLSMDFNVRNNILKIVDNKPAKIGFLIPKWLSVVICLFIWKSKKRRDFRARYVKG